MKAKFKIGIIILVIGIILIVSGLFYFKYQSEQKHTEDNGLYVSRIWCFCKSIEETELEDYVKRGNCTYHIVDIPEQSPLQQFREKYGSDTVDKKDVIVVSKIDANCDIAEIERFLEKEYYVDKLGNYIWCGCRTY